MIELIHNHQTLAAIIAVAWIVSGLFAWAFIAGAAKLSGNDNEN